MQCKVLAPKKILECLDPTCKRKFNSCWSLTRHTRTHRGEKPFKCEVEGCKKEFVEKCALTRHEQTHSDKKQWTCDFSDCGKKFKLKEYLDVHKRIHTKASSEGDETQSTTGGTDDEYHGDGPHYISININQMQQHTIRNQMRYEEIISKYRYENERLIHYLKECGTALEISVSLLQSTSPSSVPPTLSEILNKISTVNKVINTSDICENYSKYDDDDVHVNDVIMTETSYPPDFKYNSNLKFIGTTGFNDSENFDISFERGRTQREFGMSSVSSGLGSDAVSSSTTASTSMFDMSSAITDSDLFLNNFSLDSSKLYSKHIHHPLSISTLISSDHRPLKSSSNRVTKDGTLRGKLKRPRVHSRSRSASREAAAAPVPLEFASSSIGETSVDGQSSVHDAFLYIKDFQPKTISNSLSKTAQSQVSRESATTSMSESETTSCSQEQASFVDQLSTSVGPIGHDNPMISAMETLAFAASMLTTACKGVSL